MAKQSVLPNPTRRLAFSAPNRQWDGGSSTPWTEAGVREACGGGAWYKGSEHFANDAVRAVALKLSRVKQA